MKNVECSVTEREGETEGRRDRSDDTRHLAQDGISYAKSVTAAMFLAMTVAEGSALDSLTALQSD
jgi:hypothetical protein